MTDARELQTLTLPDGRRLSHAQFGDPHGVPVVYCHGFPGSRLEARQTDAFGRRLGVRVIAFDRPGYGGSDYQRGRQLTDWPADVAAALDLLGIGRFALLGISGGAPYALAAASAHEDCTRLLRDLYPGEVVDALAAHCSRGEYVIVLNEDSVVKGLSANYFLRC
jgi:pimeloyl-ACP methyl ester carboxylesterase